MQSQQTNGSWDVIKSGGFILLLLIAFPLIMVAAMFGRAIILLLLAAGVVAYALSPAFRRWFEERSAAKTESGLRMPSDAMVATGHTWVRGGRSATIGADDLLVTALGPPDAVQLPAAGAQVNRGDVLFSLARDDRSVEVRSPVSGTVTEVNATLRESPDRLAQSPYRLGWVARIRRNAVHEERYLLRRGREARRWFRAEVDRLLASVQADPLPTPVLQDGGQIAEDFHRQIDADTWQRIKNDFFNA